MGRRGEKESVEIGNDSHSFSSHNITLFSLSYMVSLYPYCLHAPLISHSMSMYESMSIRMSGRSEFYCIFFLKLSFPCDFLPFKTLREEKK